MKKSLLWMLAAVLTCGSMFTSCASNEDSPVQPEPPEPPVLPDQAAMFVQNVIDDGRYTPDVLKNGEEQILFLRLDVADYEEAKAEFLKLLPEGVAETAFEMSAQLPYSERTGYKLNAPQNNDIDSIAFAVTAPNMISLAGYAWVFLTDDMQEALQVNALVYMPQDSNDDLDNFMKAFMDIMPMCQPDPEDPTHIICTLPSMEVYTALVPAFITTKMMQTMTLTEEGDRMLTLTDKDGKSYGKLILVPKEEITDGSHFKYLLDEDLQASFKELLGIPSPVATISFVIAGTEPAAE